MNKISTFIFLCFLISNYLAQFDSTHYYLNSLQYKKSINYLKKKLKNNAYIKYENGNTTAKDVDMINLACIYSLNKNYKECITTLNSFVKSKTKTDGTYIPNKWSSYASSYGDYYIDPDFYRVSVSLPNEWKYLLINHKHKCEITDTSFKKLQIPDSVYIKLIQIGINDQAHYREISFYENKYGTQSSTALKLWKEKDSLNKANLKTVMFYLDNGYNVLSDSIVGKFSNKCFLVIQHADFKTQERILPIIKDLYDQKKTSGNNYALLFDRISVDKNNGTQFYGTQINPKTNKPYLIKDEANLDKRRAELGMETMAEYCKRFNIIYKPKK